MNKFKREKEIIIINITIKFVIIDFKLYLSVPYGTI